MIEQYLKDYVYLVLGFIIILLALAFSKKLGNQPVNLGWEKIGFSLAADRLTLFFFLGFVIIGVGVYFSFRGYETRLSNLEKDLISRETVKEQLSTLKDYEFDMIFDFDTTLNISPQDQDLEYILDRRKGGRIDQKKITPTFGEVSGIWIHLERIKPGDKFKIVARRKSNNEKWESEEIEVPKTRIKLNKVND